MPSYQLGPLILHLSTDENRNLNPNIGLQKYIFMFLFLPRRFFLGFSG